MANGEVIRVREGYFKTSAGKKALRLMLRDVLEYRSVRDRERINKD